MLEAHASSVFIIPDNLKAASFTNGDGNPVAVPPETAYMQLKAGDRPQNNLRRRDAFEQVDKAYGDTDLSTPLSAFLSEQGQMFKREIRPETSVKPLRPKFFNAGVEHKTIISNDRDDGNARLNLLDMTEVSQFFCNFLKHHVYTGGLTSRFNFRAASRILLGRDSKRLSAIFRFNFQGLSTVSGSPGVSSGSFRGASKPTLAKC
jgi:hypothetical protein